VHVQVVVDRVRADLDPILDVMDVGIPDRHIASPDTALAGMIRMADLHILD